MIQLTQEKISIYERLNRTEGRLQSDLIPIRGNPFSSLNNNPNQPLQDGVAANPCVQYIQWGVDTENPVAKGSVTNIPFEKQKTNVVDYSANYWLQAFIRGGEFTQLSYNQTILMNIPINGTIVKFPYITCNTLTKNNKDYFILCIAKILSST